MGGGVEEYSENHHQKKPTLSDLPTLKSLKPEHLFYACGKAGKGRAKLGPQRKGVWGYTS